MGFALSRRLQPDSDDYRDSLLLLITFVPSISLSSCGSLTFFFRTLPAPVFKSGTLARLVEFLTEEHPNKQQVWGVLRM